VEKHLFGTKKGQAAPFFSIVVNFYNNRREARNTLHSLSRAYQLDVHDIRYEVIALDNGSTEPLCDEKVAAFGPEFRYRFVNTKSVSPVVAMNEACRDAAGEHLIVMIDGAHIVTPRVIRLVREAFSRFLSPFVATVAFCLGPTKQNLSVQAGYDQQVEDELLKACDWKRNGYGLYAASASFADESGGWYGQLFESCCFAIRKVDYLALGGFDERFQSRGGGLTNLDLFQRALIRDDLTYVMLLGEGTFHQVHGGVSTSVPMEQHPWKEFHQEFMQIRGHPFMRVPRKPVLLGNMPKEALHVAEFSKRVGAELWQRYPPVMQ
jgi:glycosyltransferase involved in cell wall biosynthesis